MRFTIYALLGLTLLTGCSVISYNRVFPKLDWAWSKEAREQRADRAQEKEFEKSLATNSPAR